jgi:RND family efflux transporter MFP subunit
MQRHHFYQRVLLPLVILGCGVGSMVGLWALRAAPQVEELPDLRPLVAVQALQEATPQFDIRVNGTVAPKREVTITAEVGGTIVEKSPLCEAGIYVTEGTPLLQIDRRKYELEIQRLESMVAQAEIDLQQLEIEITNNRALIDLAERDLALRERELDKMRSLFEKNTVTEGERDRIETEVLQVRTTFQQIQNTLALLPKRRQRAEAELALRKSQLASAELDLSKTTILAPIDGVITDDPVETGQFVAPGATLLTVEDTSVIEVRCNLRVEDLYWLWVSHDEGPQETAAAGKPYHEVPPAKATVSYRMSDQFSFSERPYEWQGRLSRYEGLGIDEQTRTIPCRVEVAHPRRAGAEEGPPALVRGMFVTVRLHVAPKVPMLRIPLEALQPNHTVWSVVDDTLHLHKVAVAKILDEVALVPENRTDLKPGAQLMVTPLPTAHDGMKVRVQESP